MRYSSISRFVAALIVMTLCITPLTATAAVPIHYAVGPRLLYPNTPIGLYNAIAKLYKEAKPLTPDAKLLACVAPHSAIGLSGNIAALAFKNLKVGQYNRVIVLAGSHYATFEGCSIADVEVYETPLGLVPVDTKATQALSRHGLFSLRGLQYVPNDFGAIKTRDKIHEAEHSIEMVLPFLQMRLGEFKLVPIIVGNLNVIDELNVVGSAGIAPKKPNRNVVKSVAEAIEPFVDEKTLIVVSTDLTHYGLEHEFLFQLGEINDPSEVPDRIEALDKKASELIRNRNFDAFQSYLDNTRNKICGETALKVLFELLPSDARGLELGRSKEADILGSWDLSISFAAINFYDLAKPPLPGGDPDILLVPKPQSPESEDVKASSGNKNSEDTKADNESKPETSETSSP